MNRIYRNPGCFYCKHRKRVFVIDFDDTKYSIFECGHPSAYKDFTEYDTIKGWHTYTQRVLSSSDRNKNGECEDFELYIPRGIPGRIYWWLDCRFNKMKIHPNV